MNISNLTSVSRHRAGLVNRYQKRPTPTQLFFPNFQTKYSNQTLGIPIRTDFNLATCLNRLPIG